MVRYWLWFFPGYQLWLVRKFHIWWNHPIATHVSFQVTKIFNKKKNVVTYTMRQMFPLCGMQVYLFETSREFTQRIYLRKIQKKLFILLILRLSLFRLQARDSAEDEPGRQGAHHIQRAQRTRPVQVRRGSARGYTRGNHSVWHISSVLLLLKKQAYFLWVVYATHFRGPKVKRGRQNRRGSGHIATCFADERDGSFANRRGITEAEVYAVASPSSVQPHERPGRGYWYGRHWDADSRRRRCGHGRSRHQPAISPRMRWPQENHAI